VHSVTERPDIAAACYRRSAWNYRQIAGGILIVWRGTIQTLDAKIDLAHVEAGHFEAEVKVKYG
jgi:hypothetical protein